jgi:uncharacterized membrane protein
MELIASIGLYLLIGFVVAWIGNKLDERFVIDGGISSEGALGVAILWPFAIIALLIVLAVIAITGVWAAIWKATTGRK